MAAALLAQPAGLEAQVIPRPFLLRRDRTEGPAIRAIAAAAAAALLRLALPERQPATEEPERLRRSPGHQLHTLAAAAEERKTGPRQLGALVAVVLEETSHSEEMPWPEQQISVVVAAAAAAAQVRHLLLEQTAGLVLL